MRTWLNFSKESSKHPRELARHITKRFGVSAYNSERLMRTELARVQTAAQERIITDNGYDEFVFLAENSSRTCEICRGMNGKHFEIKAMVVGKNTPPLHPMCRCSTSAYMNEDAYEKWLDSKYEADKLLDRAKNAEPKITEDLKSVMTGSKHSTLEGLEYRIKSEESLKRKLRDKAEEKNLSIGEYAKKITDVVRYTSLSDKENFTSEYFKTIDLLREKGYTQVEVTNTFPGVSVYKGVNTLMKSQDGYVFELQFHTPESWKAKTENHKLYEKWRDRKTSEREKTKLFLRMLKTYKDFRMPKNIEYVKDVTI